VEQARKQSLVITQIYARCANLFLRRRSDGLNLGRR